MTTANSTSMTLSYEGSVKRVWQSSTDKEHLWFEFTNDYSIFDWGKMPDTIANKGRALALMGAFFFQELGDPKLWQTLFSSKHLAKFDRQWLGQRFTNKTFCGAGGLEKAGLSSHFVALTNEQDLPLPFSNAIEFSGSLLMKVLGGRVYRPQPASILQHNLFFYPQPENSRHIRLIPLEIVFRFGMPQGSSLQERLSSNPNYFKTLGLPAMPRPDTWFAHPVIEFFTKLEPKDRFLNWQEAATLSDLNEESFAELTEIALDTALALHEIFARCGLELWDGKIELVEARSDDPNRSQLLLADSIGPDELRILADGKQLSKELIRQFYRGSVWEQRLKEAQSIAKERAVLDWKTICLDELDAKPEKLSAEFKQQADKLYGVLANTLIGSDVFPNHPPLDEFLTKLSSVIKAKSK